MKVLRKTVFEATRITEEMVREPEILPAGIRLTRRSLAAPDANGQRRIIHYTLKAETSDAGDYGPSVILIDMWYVTDSEGFADVLTDEEFEERYKPLGQGS